MHAKGDFLTESESYSMDSKFLYVMFWPYQEQSHGRAECLYKHALSGNHVMDL